MIMWNIFLIRGNVNNNSFYVIDDKNIIYNLLPQVLVVGRIKLLLKWFTWYVNSLENFQLQPPIIVEAIILTVGSCHQA